MTTTTDKTYLEPYREAVARAGPTWEAQLWRDPEGQAARFDAIARAADLAGRTIADLGCGRGDLAAFLIERRIAFASYLGVDAIGAMVEEAARRAHEGGWSACSFEVADFVANTDLGERLVRERGAGTLIVSGSLNTLTQAEAQRTLARFWDAVEPAGGTLVFNFLCERRGAPAQTPGDPAVRFNGAAMLDWALARTREVRYLRDYLGGHDATIAMRAHA
ncbi:MAG: methyltransferase domain-containing protein [Phycisphaerales bacterium]